HINTQMISSSLSLSLSFSLSLCLSLSGEGRQAFCPAWRPCSAPPSQSARRQSQPTNSSRCVAPHSSPAQASPLSLLSSSFILSFFMVLLFALHLTASVSDFHTFSQCSFT